jgi:hypothetical protein
LTPAATAQEKSRQNHRQRMQDSGRKKAALADIKSFK